LNITFKYIGIIFVVIFIIIGVSNTNLDYVNCMKSTKHSYISKQGVDHISAQCEAFIRDKVMVK